MTWADLKWERKKTTTFEHVNLEIEEKLFENAYNHEMFAHFLRNTYKTQKGSIDS